MEGKVSILCNLRFMRFGNYLALHVRDIFLLRVNAQPGACGDVGRTRGSGRDT